jgi:5'-nucleotidase
MKILFVNDDGVHSQGLIQFAKLVKQEAEVFVVGPRVEQSGVSQAITFLSPLFPIRLGSEFDTQDDGIEGYSVNGTPVDCLKLALGELCPWKPDLVISGINGGLNAGINVCHSGTVGGALAASTFGIPAVAVSLEYTTKEMQFKRAAEIAWPLIKKIVDVELPDRTVVNINIPTAALAGEVEVVIVPVEPNPMAYHFDKGNDPKGRPYFWSTTKPNPEPSPFETDTQALLEGKITISTVCYDLNAPVALEVLSKNL